MNAEKLEQKLIGVLDMQEVKAVAHRFARGLDRGGAAPMATAAIGHRGLPRRARHPRLPALLRPLRLARPSSGGIRLRRQRRGAAAPHLRRQRRDGAGEEAHLQGDPLPTLPLGHARGSHPKEGQVLRDLRLPDGLAHCGAQAVRPPDCREDGESPHRLLSQGDVGQAGHGGRALLAEAYRHHERPAV